MTQAGPEAKYASEAEYFFIDALKYRPRTNIGRYYAPRVQALLGDIATFNVPEIENVVAEQKARMGQVLGSIDNMYENLDQLCPVKDEGK